MSSPKKWRQSDGVYRETETIDNVYKYDSYTNMILKYPFLAQFISKEEWREYKEKYQGVPLI